MPSPRSALWQGSSLQVVNYAAVANRSTRAGERKIALCRLASVKANLETRRKGAGAAGRRVSDDRAIIIVETRCEFARLARPAMK